jgi:hypothetical protein
MTKDNGYIATGVIDLIFGGPTRCAVIKLGPDYINNPPSSPIIKGPSSGKPGIEYDYTFNSTDFDKDNVTYVISWGDNSSLEFVGPIVQGVDTIASHIWFEKGDYMIIAKTIDDYGLESEWSDPYPITMPRKKIMSIELIQRFIEKILGYCFLF